MTRHIYALLVGTDEYMATVTALKGCVNDVTAVKAYLEGRKRVVCGCGVVGIHLMKTREDQAVG